tara:strand:+ start:1348 stop:1587 length:240 start_codon:yes stop_codon:yes gene_type:complete
MRKKKIIVELDTNKLKNKIQIFRDEIYDKQKLIIEFIYFYKYTEKEEIRCKELKKIKNEIKILEDRLTKTLILYKQYKK